MPMCYFWQIKNLFQVKVSSHSVWKRVFSPESQFVDIVSREVFLTLLCLYR